MKIIGSYCELVQLGTQKELIMNAALHSINTYEFSAVERKQDAWLRQNKNIDLRSACRKVITNAKIITEDDSTFAVFFTKKEDDNMAAFITYGNLEVPGSTILENAFNTYT